MAQRDFVTRLYGGEGSAVCDRAQRDCPFSIAGQAAIYRPPGCHLASGRGACFNRVQFLARLEAHRLAGCDADLGAGTGIAADSGFAGADAEHTKSAQFDALAGSQSLLKALEDRIHSRLRLGAWKPGALDYVMDDVLFNQRGNLAGATPNECTTPYIGDATDFEANMEHPNGFIVIFLLKKKTNLWVSGQVGRFKIEREQPGLQSTISTVQVPDCQGAAALLKMKLQSAPHAGEIFPET
jgi:hypothetical protein